MTLRRDGTSLLPLGLALIMLGLILGTEQRVSQVEQRVNTACADVQKLYDATVDDMTYRDTQIIQDDLQCPVGEED